MITITINGRQKMAKLYFKYGAMGSSKSAQALITKFNYEEGNNKVWFLKPSIDTREGDGIVRSRIGIEAPVQMIDKNDNLVKLFKQTEDIDVIIIDEAQFLSTKQVEQLRQIINQHDIDAICYGLKNDFRTKLFPGSQRLLELSENIEEIKTMCACGRKASVNARFDNGKLVTKGDQIMIGGNESYKAVCYQCYNKMKAENNK